MSEWAVGTRWKTNMGGQFELTRFASETDWTVMWFDGVKADSEGQTLSSYVERCTVVAPGYGPEAPRDWARWLPPFELPQDKSIVYKVGQIWALRWDKGSERGTVFRVQKTDKEFRRADNHFMDVQVLAGSGSGGYSNRDYTERAVLVADVGREPTPPEVLYAAPTPVIAPPPATVAGLRPDVAALIKKRDGFTMPVRVDPTLQPGEWRLEDCAPENQNRRRPGIPASCQLERWDETGPLSARAIIAMKDRLPKPEPWVESCDPLHWIPDA